tara:strand:- start:497 stop:1150 length:654 start_codon:yes stop_codon:yes gene_type:complete
MSGIKTVEELQRELHNAKASLSYHKNKHKHNKKKKKPLRSSRKAEYSQMWNDNKRAMSVVIARLTTTTEEEFKQVRDQAESMSIVEARELTKGHEEEVQKEVLARQEKREARGVQDATAKMLDEWSSPDTPAVKEVVPETVLDLVRSSGVDWGKVSEARSPKSNYTTGESSVEAIVHVKASTLRLAVAAVESNTGFDGLSKNQVVGHIISRYLEDNS